ncbi:MAG: hypothetical protein K2X82_17410 [Gemmataceae bacterium]|nr:hypothetical protein [Gemmataceae bacterium]
MPTVHMDIGDLAARADDIAGWVDEGHEVFVTRDGKELFRLARLGPPVPPEKVPAVVFNLHRGQIIIGPDFNDPLPASFWSEDAG